MFDKDGKLDERSRRILSEQTIPPRYGRSPAMTATRLIYTAQPGERLKLLPDGTTIVAHPEREPFLIDGDGKRRQLTCPYNTEHRGNIYVAHGQTIYRLDEKELTPIEFTTDADQTPQRFGKP